MQTGFGHVPTSHTGDFAGSGLPFQNPTLSSGFIDVVHRSDSRWDIALHASMIDVF